MFIQYLKMEVLVVVEMSIVVFWVIKHFSFICKGSEWNFREIGWGGGGVEWIHLAQDRDLWRALMNAVMNLRVLAPRN
jgi:hypothetical protein